MSLTEIKGDILLAKETYIAHQCNCVTNKAKGLSKQIFKKFPYADSYTNRQNYSNPGTIEVFNNVINMYAQFYPSKAKYKNDSKELRIEFFENCLKEISLIPGIHYKSIAMPYKIGCGLAGGDWPTYKKILEDFCINEDITIVLYNNE